MAVLVPDKNSHKQVLKNSSNFFFDKLFPKSARISALMLAATDGADRIFSYHLMSWRDSHPR